MAAALKILALVGVTGVAAIAHGDARIAHGNDAFSELDPPLDDTGFTADLAFAMWRPWGDYDVGGSYLHRWLTAKDSRDREDLVELTATGTRRWGERHRELVLGVRTGPVLTGNWGGRWMQNAWHSVSGTGPTLDEGLADHYPADRALGWLAGARGAGAWGIPALQAYGVADAQLSAGTGVSSIELAAGLRTAVRIRCVEFGAHVEGALDRFHAADSALTLRGGYGTTRWERAWRVGVQVAWGRTQIQYEYRANEGGSGEPIGVVAVTIKQSGHTF